MNLMIVTKRGCFVQNFISICPKDIYLKTFMTTPDKLFGRVKSKLSYYTLYLK